MDEATVGEFEDVPEDEFEGLSQSQSHDSEYLPDQESEQSSASENTDSQVEMVWIFCFSVLWCDTVTVIA